MHFATAVQWMSPSGCSQLERGGGSITGVDPGEYYTFGFCNLVVNLGCALGPLEASALAWS